MERTKYQREGDKKQVKMKRIINKRKGFRRMERGLGKEENNIGKRK